MVTTVDSLAQLKRNLAGSLSLVSQRSRVLADPGAGISGAGQWRPADGAAQVMTIDSTFTRRPGVSTLKIDATATSGAFNKTYRHAMSSTALTGPLEFWLFVPPTTAGGHTITVRYSSDTPADPPTATPTNYIEMVFTNDKIQSGYWAPLFFSSAGKLYAASAPNGVSPTIVGSPDAANLKQVEINWNISAATPSVERTIWVDQVAANGKGKPKLIMGFDGFAYTSHAAIVRPLFDRYGLKGYLAGDGENIFGDGGAIADSRPLPDSLYARGWDIMSQGMEHKNYVTNIADLSADFDECKGLMRTAGYLRALDFFAYPFNSRNLATDAILSGKGVKWARTTGYNRIPVTSLGSPEMLVTGALDIGQKTAAQVQAWVDDAILCGYSLCLYGHEITTTASTGTQTATAEFNTMMAYFADKHYAGDIEVVTPSEFVKLAA